MMDNNICYHFPVNKRISGILQVCGRVPLVIPDNMVHQFEHKEIKKNK